MDTKETLEALRNLDLSKYPVQEAVKLIRQLRFGNLVKTLFPGEMIIRARINQNNEIFKNKSELSYKPQEFNNTYQRASTPNTTMFYGSINPDNYVPRISDNDKPPAQITAICETSQLFRDKSIENGSQKITLSKWIVTSNINLVSIINIHSMDEESRKKHNEFMYNKYKEELENTFIINEYLSREFSKLVAIDSPDYNYLISALFSERITKMRDPSPEIKLSGVNYRSVMTELKGTNVAISPWFVDACLNLEGVVEGTIFKEDNELAIIWDREAYPQNEADFEFKNIVYKL